MSGERDQCRRLSSALRRARTAICIWAMPIRRCSISIWRSSPAAGSCCGSRISTRPAAGRNSRPRLIRISTGSASHGSSRCGGNPGISTTIATRSKGFRPGACFIQVSKAGPRSHDWSNSARRTVLGRATPTARRSIRARRNHSPAMSARDGFNRVHPLRCGSIWRRPARSRAISTGSNTAKVLKARPVRSPPGRRPGATSFSPAGRRRPAITSRW